MIRYTYDDEDNDYNCYNELNTSESNECDNLSKEGVGMYNSGTQVSAFSNDVSNTRSVMILICAPRLYVGVCMFWVYQNNHNLEEQE